MAAATSANEDADIEALESEISDQETSPAAFEIVTYPADFTLEGLVAKFNKGDIKVPGFQRKYVWSQNQASKLVESFLLGLPVPAMFLYVDADDGRQLVVDGQQRLRSVAYFFEGYFGEENRGRRPVFRLSGLNDKSPFANQTYKELETSHPKAARDLNNAVMRSFVVKQLNPADSTSVYHVFERLNTGGLTLTGQEIRNCVYHGKFNDLLNDLNEKFPWRGIFGRSDPDRRMRDTELILRFFALHYDRSGYSKPMKDFLSGFMKKNRNPEDSEIVAMRDLFTTTCARASDALGEKPFRLKAGLNAAVFDAVFSAIAANPGADAATIRARSEIT